MICLWETEAATCSHSFLPHIWILIVKEIQDGILDEVDCTHCQRLEIEHLECSKGESNHLCAFSCTLVIELLFILFFFLCDAALFNEIVEELLIVLVKDCIVEFLQLFLWTCCR